MKFCNECAAPMPASDSWPRRCGQCGKEHFRNPIPVAVVLIPISGRGVLTVRRSIPPGQGKLALPGGFINWGETWQEGAVREVYEEIGLSINSQMLALLDAVSVGEGVVLLFCCAPPQDPESLESFQANQEVSEIVVLDVAEELAFPTHTQMLTRFLASRR